MANVAGAYLLTGETPQRFGNGHASTVPYQVFATADIRLMLAAGNNGQFAALCSVVDRMHWVTDERFQSNAARVNHRQALVDLPQPLFRTRPTQAWIEVCWAPACPAGR